MKVLVTGSSGQLGKSLIGYKPENIDLIKVCTAVAPLFGLFGTITGMMEVFHILVLVELQN